MRTSASVAAILVLTLGTFVACGGSNGADVLGTQTGDGGVDPGDGSTGTDGNSTSDATTDTGCPDKDGDGVTVCAGDCDDNDPNNFPGNVETCGDAKDNNCAGGADENCGGLGTFVSGAKGDDANPGTQLLPVKTIAKGMANAKTIGAPRTVFVAASHYPENIDLSEGVSLSGGFLCDATTCTWARNPKVNDTAILSQRITGLVADATITKATFVDGFRIQGQDVAGSAALGIDGGSPTITNNVINGGAVGNNAQRTVGIAIFGPTNDQVTGAVIRKNTINGGAGGNNTSSAAVAISRPIGPVVGNPAVARVVANTINGGTVGIGGQSIGIYLAPNGSGATTLLEDNDIEAGTSGLGGRSSGILTNSLAKINANRINLNRASGAQCSSAGQEICGAGIASSGSTSTITNNVAFGPRGNSTAGLRATDGELAVGAIIVNGNYFDGGGDGSVNSQSAGVAIRIFAGVNATIGSFRNNILMGGTNISRYGMLEEFVLGKTCHPLALDHNDFFFSALGGRTDVLYRFETGVAAAGSSYTLAQLQASAVTSPAPAANLNSDCLFNGVTGVLGAGSPCANAGTATEAPPKDLQGDVRPKGAAIDIGPDEAF